MTYIKFENYVKNELQKINYDRIYDNILENNIYDGLEFKEMIQLTMFSIEKNNDASSMACLSYYLGIIKGEHEDVKELDKYQLLYVCALCDRLNNKIKPSSLDNVCHLYS